MQARFIDSTFAYDGSQLRSLFAYMNYGVLGDSVVSWVGPCDVSFEHMLDGEDLRAQSPIRGAMMTHFIVELFGANLVCGVAIQRLFSAMAIDVLKKLSPLGEKVQELYRDGDDIFLGDNKLSISIATISPVSALIHFAVNVTNDGTPVKTLALQDLQVEPHAFSKNLMETLCSEMSSIQAATCKVRPTTSY
jgi:uncharacterized protein